MSGTSLTAALNFTPQGTAQYYVDGSEYDDRIYIESMNTTTGSVTLRLEQWTGGGQFSDGIQISGRTVTYNAGRSLDPYAPILIESRGGNDRIVNLTAGKMSVYSGDGGDVITGGSAGEYIDTGAGSDLVYANGGNDTVTARDGDDTVWGGAGYDTIYGDEGKDSLRGGDDHDTIVGGIGDDAIYGENGSDRLYGMAGNDSIRGDEYNQAVYDYISGGEGDDSLEGGGGHDTIDGDWGNDTIFGGTGHDILHGNDGDDVIYGGSEADKLYGDAGNDGLFGGTNDMRDTLFGGAGSDRFLQAATRTTGFNATREDIVADGVNGVDVAPMFVHGYQITTKVGAQTLTYVGRRWTDPDVIRTDAVLALLHKEGNGPKLLTRGGVGNIGIVRHGTEHRGFNDGTWFHMTDSTSQYGDDGLWGGSDRYLRGYLLHEFGHFWQGSDFKAGGVDYWNRFKNVSGWTSVNPNDPTNYTLSTNEGRGDRWYLTNSGFVSLYARTNENEDFGESFAAYFSARARWDFYNGTGASAAPAKMQLFIDWASKIANGG